MRFESRCRREGAACLRHACGPLRLYLAGVSANSMSASDVYTVKSQVIVDNGLSAQPGPRDGQLQDMLLEKYEHAVKLKLAGYKTHTCVPNCDPQRLRDLASGKIQKRMYAEDLEKFHRQRENWLCRLAGTY